MPRRFRELAIFICLDRRMPIIIIIMTAQTPAIGMIDFMKRMYGFPPPVSYRLPFTQS